MWCTNQVAIYTSYITSYLYVLCLSDLIRIFFIILSEKLLESLIFLDAQVITDIKFELHDSNITFLKPLVVPPSHLCGIFLDFEIQTNLSLIINFSYIFQLFWIANYYDSYHFLRSLQIYKFHLKKWRFHTQISDQT